MIISNALIIVIISFFESLSNMIQKCVSLQKYKAQIISIII
jgi:hypothetical protein